jgi:predicted aspartyl protease
MDVRLVIINTTPILGTYALETLGLKPNPVTGKLEVIGPEGGYLL